MNNNQPKAYYVAVDDIFNTSMTSDTYHDPGESKYQKTGLLDAQGVPLYRKRETVPFGFRVK